MRPAVLLTALLVGLGAPLPAAGQGTTSRVVGVVRDTTGAVVPGATVTLTHEGTGASFTTVTTEAGAYVFEAVQVGVYTVTVELDGFKKFVSTGNRVVIGEPTTVNVTLEPGGLAETVQVRAPLDTVQLSTSGNIGTNFEQRVIESLPIVGARGRNPLTLVLTQPGVVSGANTGGGVHVHGARDRAWNYTLDGIDTNETSAGGSNFSPLRVNPDALAEFQVITGNMTAEYGRNSGGQVAMITRSGTNHFDGTLFYFDRRPEYNANEWENNFNGLPKREFTQRMPGFSIGGPIQRNRTFFFTNTQWLRADQTQQVTRIVLTEPARRGLWRYVIGGRNTPAGAPGASVDADGNVLPGVNVGTYDIAANDPQRRGLDPTIMAILRAAPLPNTFAVGDGLNTAGFTWAAPEEEKQYDFIAKIDHVFNGSNNAFFRFAKGRQDTLCDSVNGGLPTFPGGGCIVNTERSPYNWAANWRWNPRSNIVNELVAGQNHFTFNFVIPTADASRVTFALPLGLANPEEYEFGNLRTIDTYQIVDNLAILKGAHSLKFGTNIRLQRHTDIRGSVAGANVAPVANFSTAINTVDSVAFRLPANIQAANDLPALRAAINMMLGRIGQISQGFVQRGNAYAPGGTLFEFDARYPEIDFYAQDTWKVRPNVTVDLGLRWELKLSPSNPDNLIRRPNQRVAVGEPPSDTLRWDLGQLYDDDVDNLAPSVGVAWDPRGDGKSVIRANYRLAYDRINTFVLSSSIFQSIPGITTAVANTAFGTAGGRLRDGLPQLQPTVTPESFVQPPPVSSASIRVVDPEFQSPLTHGWLLSYQRELWSRGTLEIAYIGRRGSHLFGAYDVNQAEIRDNGFLEAFNIVRAGGESALINRLLGPHSDRRANETGSQLMRRLFATELSLNSVAAVAGTLARRIQGGRSLAELAGLGPFFFVPYPQFLGGFVVIDSNDWSRYHALEVKLTKRFSSGYSYLLAYTLSRSKDTRSFDPAFTVVSTGAAQSASSTPFDIRNRALNYALSDFDRTHVFQAQWVWELPFGRGKRWGGDAGPLANALIGGWQVSGQMVLMSGRPFTIYSGAHTLSSVVQTPANCTGCDGTEGAVYRETDGIVWYLTAEERAKFGIPDPGAFSNAGRNAFRGPGSFNMNLSIAKRIETVDGQFLEIRGDATNVTNTPTFGLPAATITSPIFGRIRDSVASTARQVMLGVKYSF
ncbi:MAG TPA: carboxypeptidase regulatory-like domain-containing protein [Vicinamibacterales bacterium]|nr:carboxypeptidase regulatory-like domain-containing protein [Vicinamibacterales bacterium]